MSKAQGRRVSVKDIQIVQQHIEKCLLLYMTRREAVNKLFHSAEIEPVFTEIVWRRLEAQNKEFFKAYSIRVIVKGQILRFNHLLQRQVEFMNLMTLSNSKVNGNSGYGYPQPHGDYFPQQCMQLANMALPQNSNAGVGNCIMLGVNYNLLEPHNLKQEVSLSPFDGGQSSLYSSNESMSETDMSSFAMEQMTQDFNLSDAAPGFSNGTEAEIWMLKAMAEGFAYQGSGYS